MGSRRSRSRSSRRGRIGWEASEWVAKQDSGLTSDDQDHFLEWLAIDSRHRKIYGERLALWKRMNGLEEWRPAHSLEANPDLLANGDTRGRLKGFLKRCLSYLRSSPRFPLTRSH